MARSLRLRELQQRITKLRQRCLPAKFDETGAYTERQFDRTRGFRVLAHAEIEACLEELGITTVNEAFKAWSIDGKPRTTLVALMMFDWTKALDFPEVLDREPPKSSRGRLDTARKGYVNWVRNQNHGIREHNVLRILLPAGIREHEIDSGWLEQIDAFGGDRGTTAHQAAGQPQTPPDPASELQTVLTILDGLIPIDRRLTELRNE